jgi:hypothetical protein
VHCRRTSSDHRLKVSISVAAHTPIRAVAARRGIQPACAMLLPRLPTYITASSSSSSSAFDMHTSPSVDPESKSRGRSEDREKCKDVMSSECVEVCFLSGAAGCRGSLESHRVVRSGLYLDDHDTTNEAWRTSTGLVHHPVGALFQRQLSGRLKIRHRKQGFFVRLRMAL